MPPPSASPTPPPLRKGGAVEKWIRRPVSRVLCRRSRNSGIGDHSSGPPLAGRFSRPTRTAQAYDSPTLLRRGYAGRTVPIRSCSWRGLPCRPCYQARGGLLPHPFTLPSPERGGLLSVALSLGSPPAGVTRRHAVVEPGLSSTPLREPRPPSRLVRAEPEGLGPRGQANATGRLPGERKAAQLTVMARD